MELVKNIFFNTDKLVQNSTIKISYVGDLFQKNANELYIHYGFGTQWENVKEIKMEKTELGFQSEIEIPETDILNFCFKNEKGEWDNNFGQNFSFPVEKVELETEQIEEKSLIAKGEDQMQIRKGLRKTYIWSKKVKLAIYKILHYVPKIISGNYKKKIED